MSGAGESAPLANHVQDLPSKYEKLASEYAKIKAQAIVLKKAVVDEQKLNGELKQTLRTQEQTLRKNEQEMESLTFRNQQLTKRVTILQDDLEDEKKKSGKKGGKKLDTPAVSHNSNNGVMDDLKTLIQEKAKLYNLLQEKEDAHHVELASLNEQIDRLRRDLRESQAACRTIDEKYEPIIARLKRDKEEKDERLRILEAIAENLNSLQKKFDSLEGRYRQLEYFTDNMSKHFNLDGLNSMQLNNVNLSDECEQYLHKCIVDIITGLTSFFSQLINRLSYISDVAFQNKFDKVHMICTHGKGMIEKYISKNCLDSVSVIEYRNLLDNLLDNVKSVHKSQHSNLSSNLIDFISHLIRIFNVLPYLFIEKTKIYISNSSLTKVICELVVFEQLAKMLKSIFQNETQLELKSNLRNMEELMSVNDCFLESLASVEGSLQVLANALTQLLLGLNQPVEKQEVHRIILEFSRKASSHLVSSQTRDTLDSKSSDEKFQLQSAELDSLRAVYTKQICELQASLERLEKEKLALQTMYDLLSLKTNENARSSTKSSEENRGETEAADSVETEIVEYYRGKLNALIEEKQKAEGRATLVSSECVALHKRLEYLIDSEHDLQELMVKWKQYAAQLKDELRSTTENYETQLSALSEHLVELNVDLNDKREVIENLNLQVSSKGTKSKSKS